jgi:hypothetical protein
LGELCDAAVEVCALSSQGFVFAAGGVEGPSVVIEPDHT